MCLNWLELSCQQCQINIQYLTNIPQIWILRANQTCFPQGPTETHSVVTMWIQLEDVFWSSGRRTWGEHGEGVRSVQERQLWRAGFWLGVSNSLVSHVDLTGPSGRTRRSDKKKPTCKCALGNRLWRLFSECVTKPLTLLLTRCTDCFPLPAGWFTEAPAPIVGAQRPKKKA